MQVKADGGKLYRCRIHFKFHGAEFEISLRNVHFTEIFVRQLSMSNRSVDRGFCSLEESLAAMS